MSISSKDILALRKISGAGMLQCKKALIETNNDQKKAIQLLRKKGIEKMSSSARASNDGAIAFFEDDKKVASIILNCETDFVARGEKFLSFLYSLKDFVLKSENINDLKSHKYDAHNNIGEYILYLSSQLESIQLKEFYITEKSDSSYVGHYIHNSFRQYSKFDFDSSDYDKRAGAGTIVAICHLNIKDYSYNDLTQEEKTLVAELGNKISIHIASNHISPLVIYENEISTDLIKEEESIAHDKAVKEGKKPEIIDKIVQGRLSKFKKEISLFEQSYCLDEKIQIKKLISDVEGKINKEIQIKSFNKYSL